MKTRKKELDVDFIGGSAPLTKDEEKRISDIISKRRKSKQEVAAKKSKTKLTSKKKMKSYFKCTR